MKKTQLVAKVDHDGVVTIYDTNYMPMVSARIKHPRREGGEYYKKISPILEEKVQKLRQMHSDNLALKKRLKESEHKILSHWWKNLNKMFNV